MYSNNFIAGADQSLVNRAMKYSFTAYGGLCGSSRVMALLGLSGGSSGQIITLAVRRIVAPHLCIQLSPNPSHGLIVNASRACRG
jgi:hypothetical protein